MASALASVYITVETVIDEAAKALLEDFDAVFDRRVVYDANEQPSIVVFVRKGGVSSNEILRINEFLTDHWSTGEREA